MRFWARFALLSVSIVLGLGVVLDAALFGHPIIGIALLVGAVGLGMWAVWG